jgi:hypothetical protein
MKKVQCRKKKIHATSPQKFGDWSFTNFEKIKILFRQNNVSAVVFMEDTAVRDAAPRMSCAVLASAAWRALKGASQAVCGPRGRSVVSAGSLPGVGSCCSASMWVRRGKVGHRAGTGTLMLVHAVQTS